MSGNKKQLQNQTDILILSELGIWILEIHIGIYLNWAYFKLANYCKLTQNGLVRKSYKKTSAKQVYKLWLTSLEQTQSPEYSCLEDEMSFQNGPCFRC